MALVLVVGGTGFLGQRTVAALSKVEGVEVRACATWGGVHGRDQTRNWQPWLERSGGRFDGHHDHRADEWMRGVRSQHSRSRGHGRVACVERLHKLQRNSRSIDSRWRHFHRNVDLLGRPRRDSLRQAPKSLMLGIASSPFSGAGVGTIELMLASMRVRCAISQREASEEAAIPQGLTFHLEIQFQIALCTFC